VKIELPNKVGCSNWYKIDINELFVICPAVDIIDDVFEENAKVVD
jgi:hypothetical protein